MLNICFRTTANHAQGMGDLMGCLSLAEEFRRLGHDCSFMVEADEPAVKLLTGSGYRFVVLTDRANETDMWGGKQFDIVIFNRLNSAREELFTAKKYAELLVTLDDTGEAARELADVRINPLYFSDGAFSDPSYIPLSKAFIQAHQIDRSIAPEISKVLVCMGGADTYNFSERVAITVRAALPESQVILVAGPASALKTVGFVPKALSEESMITILNAVTQDKMASLILDADVAVIGGGNMLFEAACCGTPAIIVCSEPFEEETAYRMAEQGFGSVMPFRLTVNEELLRKLILMIKPHQVRTEMSLRGRSLVDGKGVSRTAAVVINAHKALSL